jgi:hypothetical protein
VPLVFDSGASISLTPYKSDFVYEESLDSSEEFTVRAGLGIQGITGAKSSIKGVGKIHLSVYTDTGSHRHIETNAMYQHVPDATVRLLSICQYREETAGQKKCSFILVSFYLPSLLLCGNVNHISNQRSMLQTSGLCTI